MYFQLFVFVSRQKDLCIVYEFYLFEFYNYFEN